MYINKNGLEIDLNFDYSLNEKDLPELEDINKEKEVKEGKEVISQNNVMAIESNVSSITFLQKPKEISENQENKENIENKENSENKENKNNKENIDNKENNEINQNNKNINIQFEENNFNFPIISRKKMQDYFIINKTSKFDILKNITKIPKKEGEKNQIFEIITIDNINLPPSNKVIENNDTKKDEIVKEEKKEEKDVKKDEKKETKIFTNLNKINENKIVLSGQKRDVKMDIQYKINEIEIKGKEKEKEKGKEKENIEKKYDKIDIVNKVNNLQLIASYNRENKENKENKENEIKNKKLDETKIKLEQKEKEFLIHINGEKTISIPKQPLKVQKNTINIQILNKKKRSRGYINVKENVINFFIKGIQNKKKNSEILFKKVDNFININDTSQFKSKLLKNQNENNIKIKEERKKNPQLDILKTKSPNQIKIKKVPSNLNTNPNIDKININTFNNDNLFKEENSIAFNKIKNNESLPVPAINSDVMNLEKQYEKIKKDLKELYPVFSKNKQYRESFFLQLSQGNIGKYNFYLSLYKIIKDEQEEKSSNNFENYLKIKKIINGKNNGLQGKLRTKLKPLKKNSSSCSIIARNKILNSYTEENNYF